MTLGTLFSAYLWQILLALLDGGQQQPYSISGYLYMTSKLMGSIEWLTSGFQSRNEFPIKLSH